MVSWLSGVTMRPQSKSSIPTERATERIASPCDPSQEEME